MIETAMRRGEVVGMRWSDIDLIRQVVLLRDVKHPTLKTSRRCRYRVARRLAGFHVSVHPDLGIYLGEDEPRPQFASLPADVRR